MTTFSNSGDDVSKLVQLGTGKLDVPTSPDANIFEVFPNRFKRPYIISLGYPEFTSLCPVTGQPDFATIILEYIPHELCVESKSYKLYMFAYRNHQSFMESITNNILDDVVKTLSPYWCRVKGIFTPRGATHIHVFAEDFKDCAEKSEIEKIVHEYKVENKGRFDATSY